MSILITNEEFPQSCWGCPCCSVQDNGFAGWEHYCNLLDEFVNDYQHLRHKLCPLVELPKHHGRLIDEKELYNKIESEFDGCCAYDVSPNEAVYDFEEIVDQCKTIIEAEE